MEKLMKPAEYAKELGISRQAVYAKIKRGILTAKDVEGKLYIVVDSSDSEEKRGAAVPHSKKPAEKSTMTRKPRSVSAKEPEKDYEALLSAKDETISVLKDTVKDLKKSNKQISTTLRGEIDLLKEAFHEMRTLYMHQLDYQKPETEAIEVVTEESREETLPKRWIGVKKFFKVQGIEKKKLQEKILKRMKKALKSGDVRIQKIKGKLKIDRQSDYSDMVK